MERRIEIVENVLCRITWWESLHTKTPDGVQCFVRTACGQQTWVNSIRATRSEEPPTCLRCVAATATTTT